MFDEAEKEGGYGWCVTVSSFLLHAVVCGIAYSCGVIHLIFRNYFNHPSHFMTSWISAGMLAMTAFAALPGTVLTYALGHRVTVIFGGLVAAGGMAASGFCTEYYQVLLAFGIMTGLGFGIALTPSVLILDQYFYVKRPVALSIAVTGSGLGLMLVPVALYHLEELYAWKGMALVLAGLCLNICLCGAAMRDKEKRTRREKRATLKICESGLCHSGAFVAICITNFLWSFGSVIVLTYLPGYAVHVGETTEDAVTLIGILGLTSVICRPIFQMFTHSAKLDHASVFLCTIVLAAILTGLHPELFLHKAGQIGYVIIFGMHGSFWTTFVGYLSSELIGDEVSALGRGFTTTCVGLGLVGGGPLAGWVLDEMDGDYEIIFYLAGGCMLLSSCILSVANIKKCYFRPTADWCDSDSESSASSSGAGRPLNTHTDQDIALMTSDWAPLGSHEVLPCFSTPALQRADFEDQRPVIGGDLADLDDQHPVASDDLADDQLPTRLEHAMPNGTVPRIPGNNAQQLQRRSVSSPPISLDLVPNGDVIKRPRDSTLAVPDYEFRLSAIDKSPESDV